MSTQKDITMYCLRPHASPPFPVVTWPILHLRRMRLRLWIIERSKNPFQDSTSIVITISTAVGNLSTIYERDRSVRISPVPSSNASENKSNKNVVSREISRSASKTSSMKRERRMRRGSSAKKSAESAVKKPRSGRESRLGRMRRSA